MCLSGFTPGHWGGRVRDQGSGIRGQGSGVEGLRFRFEGFTWVFSGMGGRVRGGGRIGGYYSENANKLRTDDGEETERRRGGGDVRLRCPRRAGLFNRRRGSDALR